jgi:hypothetical protein
VLSGEPSGRKNRLPASPTNPATPAPENGLRESAAPS